MAKKRNRDDDRPKRTEPVARDGAYVVMLFITLAAVAIGCVLLYLDNSEYGGKSPPKEAPVVLKLGGDGALPPAPGGDAAPKGG